MCVVDDVEQFLTRQERQRRSVVTVGGQNERIGARGVAREVQSEEREGDGQQQLGDAELVVTRPSTTDVVADVAM